MEYFGKKSVSSAFRIVVDIALLLELLVIAVIVFQMIQMHPWSQKNVFGTMNVMYSAISECLFWIFSFFITLQLRGLIGSFKKSSVFIEKNVKRIQTISLILTVYFMADLCLNIWRQLNIDKFYSGESVFLFFLHGINLKVLFLAAVIFVISRAFKKGCELEEQTSLTI